MLEAGRIAHVVLLVRLGDQLVRIDDDAYAFAADRPVEGERREPPWAAARRSPRRRRSRRRPQKDAHVLSHCSAAIYDLHLVDGRPLDIAGTDVERRDPQVRQAAILAARRRSAARRQDRLPIRIEPAVPHRHAIDRALVEAPDALLVAEDRCGGVRPPPDAEPLRRDALEFPRRSSRTGGSAATSAPCRERSSCAPRRRPTRRGPPPRACTRACAPPPGCRRTPAAPRWRRGPRTGWRIERAFV